MRDFCCTSRVINSSATVSIVLVQVECRLVPRCLSSPLRRTGSVRGSLPERRGWWREFLRHYITFSQTACKVSLQPLEKSHFTYSLQLLLWIQFNRTRGRLVLRKVNMTKVSITWSDGLATKQPFVSDRVLFCVHGFSRGSDDFLYRLQRRTVTINWGYRKTRKLIFFFYCALRGKWLLWGSAHRHLCGKDRRERSSLFHDL